MDRCNIRGAVLFLLLVASALTAGCEPYAQLEAGQWAISSGGGPPDGYQLWVDRPEADIDGDGNDDPMDIPVFTYPPTPEGRQAAIDHAGEILATADEKADDHGVEDLGWSVTVVRVYTEPPTAAVDDDDGPNDNCFTVPFEREPFTSFSQDDKAQCESELIMEIFDGMEGYTTEIHHSTYRDVEVGLVQVCRPDEAEPDPEPPA